MRSSIRALFAFIGSALIAISLCGSAWRPSNHETRSPAERALFEEGRRLYDAGEFTQASLKFQSAALQAERDGSPHHTAMNWSNAGGSELAHLNFRSALPFFLKARDISMRSHLHVPFLVVMNNIASLYLEMGDPESAMRTAQEGLAAADPKREDAEDTADAGLGAPAKLQYQLATALSRLHRFDEAEPIYRQAIDGIAELGDPEESARALGNFGSDCLEANRLEEADTVLSEALRQIRLHNLRDASNILRPLARLRARQGDMRSAAALFDAAVAEPGHLTTVWDIYTDRGEFRLARNDLRGALDDFRKARSIAARMRADIVPVDRDRLTLEGNLGRIVAGLVEAGNRLAQQTSDSSLLHETFDAAEQDRIWTLRALIPAPDDWRAHLSADYWDLLTKYQANERSLLESSTPALRRRAEALDTELERREAEAASESSAPAPTGENESATAHIRRVLDADSVLFSFHVTAAGGWLWAIDRTLGASVYRIPDAGTLKPAITDFARAIETARPGARDLGCSLYRMLFGRVAPAYLAHKRWLLEPDGPLYELPFAALSLNSNESRWLFERTTLEIIPGALMLEPQMPLHNGPFLGIGDPIYNTADPRYRGARADHAMLLPRLVGTKAELKSCSLAWRKNDARLLTGSEASLSSVRAALASRPSIIHFATHIVSGPDENSSGLIALSIDSSGVMELMGPAEVVAHPNSPGLVVLNGCHSARGQALPGTGLIGLTRAWIAAGARFVVATRWDVTDEGGARMMVEFYRVLGAHPGRSPVFALQQAQKNLLQGRTAFDQTPAVWGAYFVLGRE